MITVLGRLMCRHGVMSAHVTWRHMSHGVCQMTAYHMTTHVIWRHMLHEGISHDYTCHKTAYDKLVLSHGGTCHMKVHVPWWNVTWHVSQWWHVWHNGICHITGYDAQRNPPHDGRYWRDRHHCRSPNINIVIILFLPFYFAFLLT